MQTSIASIVMRQRVTGVLRGPGASTGLRATAVEAEEQSREALERQVGGLVCPNSGVLVEVVEAPVVQ